MIEGISLLIQLESPNSTSDFTFDGQKYVKQKQELSQVRSEVWGDIVFMFAIYNNKCI